MTSIIRAESAHDFLAMLPTLAGYRPERSLVWVAFRGNRTAGVIRFDLPRRAADRDRLVAAGIGMLCRLAGVDAVVPVAYTSDPYAGRRGAGTTNLLRLAVRRAEEAGFLVRDALHVARDAWASVLDAGPCATGMPLELIERSPVALAHGDHDLGDGPTGFHRLPEADPEQVERVGAILARLRGGFTAAGTPRAAADSSAAIASLADELEGLGWRTDPVEFIEFVVAVPDDAADRTRELAWLAHLAALPVYRDAMMLQVAFGRIVGERALDDWGPAIDPTVGEMLAELLLGRSSRRPDVERVERGIAFALRAAVTVSDAHRAGVLCMAGWLSWTLGRGSAAADLFERALDADPSQGMARLLLEHLGAGAFPDWAFTEPQAAGDAEHGIAGDAFRDVPFSARRAERGPSR
ncbi:DUF4192 family protein [Agromyces sp. LHK192]|uniref:DUF4192 family protein n=1 Tax=Agromyces sp. LHK192 TaxID=2498704 RepID=UPI000FD9E47E|nr:DUF4192 family protein [Agromyces sp. LHK192]